jgi:hypothetical protein
MYFGREVLKAFMEGSPTLGASADERTRSPTRIDLSDGTVRPTTGRLTYKAGSYGAPGHGRRLSFYPRLKSHASGEVHAMAEKFMAEMAKAEGR